MHGIYVILVGLKEKEEHTNEKVYHDVTAKEYTTVTITTLKPTGNSIYSVHYYIYFFICGNQMFVGAEYLSLSLYFSFSYTQ